MKASERLAQRNELLTIIGGIDRRLKDMVGVRSFRVAQEARGLLEQRNALKRELHDLGFSAPELNEGIARDKAVTSSGSADSSGVDGAVGGGSVARRRISPQAQGVG